MVLGAHHLARYRFDDHGVSKTLCEMQGWPAPDSSVLYNFETVRRADTFQGHLPAVGPQEAPLGLLVGVGAEARAVEDRSEARPTRVV